MSIVLRIHKHFLFNAIDAQRHLVGVVSLRDLVVDRREQKIDSIMTTDMKSVYTNTD